MSEGYKDVTDEDGVTIRFFDDGGQLYLSGKPKLHSLRDLRKFGLRVALHNFAQLKTTPPLRYSIQRIVWL